MAVADNLFSRLTLVRELRRAHTHRLRAEATDAERNAVADAFDLIAVDALAAEAEARPVGAEGWRVSGVLKAKVTQKCVVTLAPVPARLEEPFERVFEPDAPDPALDLDIDPEAEDPPEPLGEGIDLGAIALETLALGLDPYPRAKGASFAAQSAAPKGVAPLTEADVKPFAALAALKDRLGEG